MTSTCVLYVVVVVVVGAGMHIQWLGLQCAPCTALCPTLQADDEYMIKDHELLLNRFISVPRSYAGFNPGAMRHHIRACVPRQSWSGWSVDMCTCSVTQAHPSIGMYTPKPHGLSHRCVNASYTL
jgi:hypothetical protein